MSNFTDFLKSLLESIWELIKLTINFLKYLIKKTYKFILLIGGIIIAIFIGKKIKGDDNEKI